MHLLKALFLLTSLRYIRKIIKLSSDFKSTEEAEYMAPNTFSIFSQ